MKKRIEFIASKRLYQGLLAGAPTQNMFNIEVIKSKSLLTFCWGDDSAPYIKETPEMISHGYICCAEIVSLVPTSKNTEADGSSMYFIWTYDPSKGETIFNSLTNQIKNSDWDVNAYDWEY